MNDKYTIAEISRFLNISKSALRYYDSIGLCKPACRDEKTGYRYYEYHQLFLLNMIGKFKKMRLSLEQIKAHSRIKNVASLEHLLLERRKILRKELDELMALEISRDNLQKRQFHTYNSIGFFVENGETLGASRLAEIPAGTYAVACHIGRYSTIAKTYRRLEQYIRANHLEIIGNSVETSLINISMTNNPDEFVTELQIPVEKE